MKNIKKSIILMLICILAVLAMSACSGYTTTADITITVNPSEAEVDVVSSEGSTFTKSGNVYTLKGARVRNYQITVSSSEGAAVEFAPSIINISMEDLKSGSFSRTVTMKGYTKNFVAQITVPSADTSAAVQGLGAEWIRNRGVFRVKVDRQAALENDRDIVVSMDGCESRIITLSDSDINSGYFFATAQLGSATKSHITFTSSYGMGTSAHSLISGKDYSPKYTYANNTTSASYIFDKGDIVQIFLPSNYGDRAIKFEAQQTYYDDVFINLNFDNDDYEKVYVQHNYYTSMYYYADGKYYDVSQWVDEYNNRYISIPKDSDIYTFVTARYMDEDRYYLKIAKRPFPSTLSEGSFNCYDEQGQIIDLSQATPISVKIKVKDVVTNQFISFYANDEKTPCLEYTLDNYVNLSFENDDYIVSHASLSAYEAFLKADSEGVCVINAIQRDISIPISDNGNNSTIGLEHVADSGVPGEIVYSVSNIDFYDEYISLYVDAYDDLSRRLASSRVDNIIVWLDSFSGGEYTLNTWFRQGYLLQVVLRYNGVMFSEDCEVEVVPQNDKLVGYTTHLNTWYSPPSFTFMFDSLGASANLRILQYASYGQKVYSGEIVIDENTQLELYDEYRIFAYVDIILEMDTSSNGGGGGKW